MVAKTAGRSGRPWRTVRDKVLKSRTCWLCGHEGAESVDHEPSLVQLRAMGLDPNNPRYLRPAHGNEGCPVCPLWKGKPRRCNQIKGARPVRRTRLRLYRW